MPLQPREPSGRFAEGAASDPGQIDLWDPTDGTFEFPPRPRDARDLLEFWSKVEVPEEVLIATQQAYNARRVLEATDILDVWEQQHPKPTGDTAYRRWYNDRAAYSTAAIDDGLDQRYPKVIHKSWLRPLVRATKMYEASNWLPRGEQQIVLATKVQMPGYAEPMTISELVGKYRMQGILPHMVDKVRLDQINQALAARR